MEVTDREILTTLFFIYDYLKKVFERDQIYLQVSLVFNTGYRREEQGGLCLWMTSQSINTTKSS